MLGRSQNQKKTIPLLKIVKFCDVNQGKEGKRNKKARTKVRASWIIVRNHAIFQWLLY